MTLSTLHANNLAVLGNPKALCCRLMRFQFIFLLLLSHLLTSILDVIPAHEKAHHGLLYPVYSAVVLNLNNTRAEVNQGVPAS